MQLIRALQSTSNIIRVTLRNSSTGQGLTGLAYNSTGLIISTLTDNEAAATAYSAAASKIETIATLGTYAAPTATKCRFREVDATNHPGLYEIQLADARFNVANAKVLRLAISGATNLLSRDVLIQFDPAPADVRKIDNDGTAPGPLAAMLSDPEAGARIYASVDGVVASVNANLVSILGTALTETAGYLAAGFRKFFNVAAPVHTVASVDQTGDSYARLGAPANATHAADVAAVKADTAAVKTKTDNLPATPAAVGSPMTLTSAYDAAKSAAAAGAKMDLVDAPNATAVAALKTGLSGINVAGVTVSDFDELALGQMPVTSPAAVAQAMFTADAGTYGAAHANSVVKQTAGNAGGASLTEEGIAAAVWAAGSRTLTSFGSLVSDLTTAIYAPLAAAVTAVYATLTAGVFGTGGNSLNAGELPLIVQGDDYTGGAAIVANVAYTGPSVAGATAVCRLQPVVDFQALNAEHVVTVTGVTIGAYDETAGTYPVNIPLPAAQSAGLIGAADTSALNYRWEIEATVDGHAHTIAVGTVTVLRQIG